MYAFSGVNRFRLHPSNWRCVRWVDSLKLQEMTLQNVQRMTFETTATIFHEIKKLNIYRVSVCILVVMY